MRPAQLADLLDLIQQGAINATVGKEVLAEMFASGEAAEEIVARKGLTQISDSDALAQVVAHVLANNPQPVQQYLDGKEAVLGYLVGQVMRETRGQANANVAAPIVESTARKAEKPLEPRKDAR